MFLYRIYLVALECSVILVKKWFPVLTNLNYAGFEAYLVGGCVRDLILNKTPKDFDVITTAKLNEVFFWHCLVSS